VSDYNNFLAQLVVSLCDIERWSHSHLTYLVQLYLILGNHRTQKMTNFAVSNILFCE